MAKNTLVFTTKTTVAYVDEDGMERVIGERADTSRVRDVDSTQEGHVVCSEHYNKFPGSAKLKSEQACWDAARFFGRRAKEENDAINAKIEEEQTKNAEQAADIVMLDPSEGQDAGVEDGTVGGDSEPDPQPEPEKPAH